MLLVFSNFLVLSSKMIDNLIFSVDDCQQKRKEKCIVILCNNNNECHNNDIQAGRPLREGMDDNLDSSRVRINVYKVNVILIT